MSNDYFITLYMDNGTTNLGMDRILTICIPKLPHLRPYNVFYHFCLAYFHFYDLEVREKQMRNTSFV